MLAKSCGFLALILRHRNASREGVGCEESYARQQQQHTLSWAFCLGLPILKTGQGSPVISTSLQVATESNPGDCVQEAILEFQKFPILHHIGEKKIISKDNFSQSWHFNLHLCVYVTVAWNLCGLHSQTRKVSIYRLSKRQLGYLEGISR